MDQLFLSSWNSTTTSNGTLSLHELWHSSVSLFTKPEEKITRGRGGKCGLVIKLDWLTSWSVQHQTQRKGKVRSAEGENRKVARGGEAGQPPSAQQPLVLAQPPCREARGHVASPDWDSHTSSHWPRLQVVLPELGRGFCCSLAPGCWTWVLGLPLQHFYPADHGESLLWRWFYNGGDSASHSCCRMSITR